MKTKDKKKIIFNIRINQDLKEKIEILSQIKQKNKTKLIEDFINEEFEKVQNEVIKTDKKILLRSSNES